MTIARDLGQFDIDAFINRADRAVTTASAAVQNPGAALIKKVGIYTAYSAPQEWTGAQIDALVKAPPEKKRPGQKSLLERIQPTIVLDTTFGKKVIAPYGVVPADAWKKNTMKLVGLFLGGLALYTAGGYYLGYKAGQRRAARGG
jgi:hypothetical protein